MAKRTLKEIELGSTQHDPVTGMAGTVTGKLEELHGEDRVRLESKDSTGRPIEFWVAVNRLT